MGLTDVERLTEAVRQELPEVEAYLDRPDSPSGRWFADFKLADHGVAVEWRAESGFGISTGPHAFGERADEVYTDLAAATKRVLDLLVSRTPSIPSSPVLLKRIRELTQFSQQQVADRMHVKQATVSKLENAADMQLSTLQRYVDALGGTVNIEVQLPTQSLQLLSTASSAMSVPGRHPIERFREAMSRVPAEYFRLATRGGPKLLERAYCYELYHQLRSAGSWEGGFQLTAESSKKGQPDFSEAWAPDFIVHEAGTVRNQLVVEVKRSLERTRTIKRDISKLAKFVTDLHYEFGLLVLIGPGRKQQGPRSPITLDGTHRQVLILWQEAPNVIKGPFPLDNLPPELSFLEQSWPDAA